VCSSDLAARPSSDELEMREVPGIILGLLGYHS